MIGTSYLLRRGGGGGGKGELRFIFFMPRFPSSMLLTLILFRQKNDMAHLSPIKARSHDTCLRKIDFPA